MLAYMYFPLDLPFFSFSFLYNLVILLIKHLQILFTECRGG